MILIIGGHASGKRAYLKTLDFCDADIAEAVLDARPVVAGAEKLAFSDPDGVDALLPALLAKQAVLCCEVGSGVIPVSDAQRRGREAAGRLTILLAQRADAVVRMVCGIPTVIAGVLP